VRRGARMVFFGSAITHSTDLDTDTTIYYNGGEKTFENFNNGYYDWTYSKGIWGANVYFWDG
jgi:hypothetical protein